jgi:hypothetical protein
LTPEIAEQAQALVTMGCGDECPYVPGAKRDAWPLEDPKGKPIDQPVAEIVQRGEPTPKSLLINNLQDQPNRSIELPQGLI